MSRNKVNYSAGMSSAEIIVLDPKDSNEEDENALL